MCAGGNNSLIEQFGFKDSGMKNELVHNVETVSKSGSEALKEALRPGGDIFRERAVSWLRILVLL